MSRRRGKRVAVVDVLGEIRKALRALRRAEQHLAKQERDERRRAEAERQRLNAIEEQRALGERSS